MIKLLPILQESSKILVPRRLEDRQAKRLQNDLRKIEEYVKQGSQGDLNLEGSPITKLPDNLVKVGGNLWLRDSEIQDLNNLREVGGNLSFNNTPLTKLPDNITIGLNLYGTLSSISEIPNNLNIGEEFYIWNTPLFQQYSLKQIKQMIIDRGGNVREVLP